MHNEQCPVNDRYFKELYSILYEHTLYMLPMCGWIIVNTITARIS
jgi:hypothetical protein